MKYGAERLIEDLEAMGFKVESVTIDPGGIFAVLRDYLIEAGKFEGRVIDLGLQCTQDFPRSVASAIHVKATPQLFETTDTIPNIRNIAASQLGLEWRYWSKNFNWTSERTARRLISQINRIFLDA
jgi:hypothetical protein